MPVYQVACSCGYKEDVVRKIDERDTDLPRHCDKPMRRVLTAPMVRCDEQVIKSMVDGKIYKSRGAYRKHLKDHGMVEMGNEAPGVKKHKDDPNFRIGPLKTPPGLKEALIRAYDQHSIT